MTIPFQTEWSDLIPFQLDWNELSIPTRFGIPIQPDWSDTLLIIFRIMPPGMLLFLHGWGMIKLVWDRFVTALLLGD